MKVIKRTEETFEAEEQESTTVSEFAKTARAAKLSGTFHGAVGFMKRKLGEATSNPRLKLSGENQQLLGQVHGLVGAIRDVRLSAKLKIAEKRRHGFSILRTHGGKLLNGMTEFTRDLKKLID